MKLLELKDLRVAFDNHIGVTEAVRNLSLTMEPGEVLGMIGESGSGKTTVMKAIMGLLPKQAVVSWRQMELAGMEVSPLPDQPDKMLLKRYEQQMGTIRGTVAGVIFQHPAQALNPSLKIGHQLTETICWHQQCERKEGRRRALELLEQVKIPAAKRCLEQFPGELSGGFNQRVMIAMALAAKPRLLIADEPTAALDLRAREQIVELLKQLAREQQLGILLISHDLEMVLSACNRVVVMQEGRLIESGTPASLQQQPVQEYTKQLLGSAKRLPLSADVLEFAGEVVRLTGISKSYRGYFPWQPMKVLAVDDVSFAIKKGETFALIGESGGGKTTLAQIIAGLLSPERGVVSYPVVGQPAVQMIFQNPQASLNPRFTIEQVLEEPLLFQPGWTKATRRQAVAQMLERIGLEAADGRKYPEQFSGGQCQRIAIARAMIGNPQLVICDEPVSALDRLSRQQIVELLQRFQQERGISYLLISHDLQVVKEMSQHTGVMYRGQLVETADTQTLFTAPQHPYTRELLAKSIGEVKAI